MRWALLSIALAAVACGGEPSDPTSSSSSSGTGAAGAGGGGGAGASSSTSSTGGAPPQHPGVLVDEGLIARYYLDEAASGNEPTHARDAAPDPLDLLLRYDDIATAEVHMQYAEDAEGHRGWRYDGQGHDSGASVAVDTTKLAAMLQGGTRITFELVADVDDVNPSSSRLIHFGLDNDHTLSFETSRITLLSITVNNEGIHDSLLDHAAYGRAVYHGVVDTTAADAAERAIFYVNGSRLQTIYASGTAQDEPLDLQTMRHFVIGNRQIGGRSIAGMIYYAAIYNVALTPAQVLQNAQLLLVNDDTP